MCSCPDHEENGAAQGFRCKHVTAALVVARVIEAPAEVAEMETATETAKPTYRQNWPAYERAQQHEREHFVTLLHHLRVWQAEEASLASERALAEVRFDSRSPVEPDTFATWLPYEVKYKSRSELGAMGDAVTRRDHSAP